MSIKLLVQRSICLGWFASLSSASFWRRLTVSRSFENYFSRASMDSVELSKEPILAFRYLMMSLAVSRPWLLEESYDCTSSEGPLLSAPHP